MMDLLSSPLSWLTNSVHTAGRLARGCPTMERVKLPNAFLNPTIHINPRRVRAVASIPAKPGRTSWFLPGDWDLSATDVSRAFEENPKFATCRQILSDPSVAPEHTAEYRMILERIGQKGAYRSATSGDDAAAYVERLRALYLGIRQHGYRTPRKPGRLFSKREVQCAVDRHGRLIKVNGGNHRFAAAYELGIPLIPVEVIAVHASLLERFAGSKGAASLKSAKALIREVEAACR